MAADHIMMTGASPKRVAIVGAGMAGLACAQKLVAQDIKVRLFDKGRGPGGRMSTRRALVGQTEVGFDHGAQYFSVRDPQFSKTVLAWHHSGLVAPWTSAGKDAWVGTPAMNAPLAAMSAEMDVAFSKRIDGLVREDGGWRLIGDDVPDDIYDHIVVAVPAEQVAPLVSAHNPAFGLAATMTPSEPCWTVLAAFAERVAVERDTLRSDGDLAWAARHSSKPGRGPVETWVLQAGPDWSRRNRGVPASEIVESLLELFRQEVGSALPLTLLTQAHSWLYARSGSSGDGHLWDASLGLGICGDWLVGPRVEGAWLSGHSLAETIIRSTNEAAS